MTARTFRLKGPWRGELVIIPRPRGGDWLRDEVSSWREAGIDVVVSFLTPEEVIELDLEAERELCEAHGIRFVSFAIPDRGVPASKVAATTLVSELKQLLVNGGKVALHCRQSVGRSALVAASLLVAIGEEPRCAFDRITSARGSRVPDSVEQAQWVADRASEDRRTKGEKLFETYLLLQGIANYEFEKGHPGKTRKPDYTVMLDREYQFEVKDFNPSDMLSPFDPYRRIRQKIDDAREKFKEYKGAPCCLVLYDNLANMDYLESPDIMIGAMEGNRGWRIELNPELGELDPTTARSEFLDGGKMMRPYWSQPQNTSISALITLRDVKVVARKLDAFWDRMKQKKPDITPSEFLQKSFSPEIDFDKHERQLGVIVWENLSADIPFPRNLFCGPYDERYVRNGNEPERVFVGSELAALEELEGPQTPLREMLR